jgi:hypothetical protein
MPQKLSQKLGQKLGQKKTHDDQVQKWNISKKLFNKKV